MKRTVAVMLLLLSIVGCSQEKMLERFTSPEEQATVRQHIELLRQKRFDEIEKLLDSSLIGADTRATLEKMSTLIPDGEPTSIKLVGVHKNSLSGVSTANFSFEYEFPGKWLLINISIKTEGDKSTVSGFHVYPQPASLEKQSEFSLEGKTPIHYLILVLALVIPVFVLTVLVIAARTKIAKRKWLWIVFILFGLGKLTLNWTTGQWAVAPLTFQLFSAGFLAPLYGYVLIIVSIPLGAIVFLVQRKKLGPRPELAVEDRPYG